MAGHFQSIKLKLQRGEKVFKIFKQPTSELSNKQKYLLSELDTWLVENLNQPTSDSTLQILHFTVPFIQTALPVETIVSRMAVNLPKSGQYAARSVAFTQEGLDWHIFVGVRQIGGTADKDKDFLFFTLLNQTNEARSK